ncbi:MAG: hypothetical protein KA998_01150, partial [Rickettsiaceae bacterium]|nr:hypothetical protein [Rickettsiaceae bacterium]
EEETFTIQEQLYRYASLARYIGDIPAGAEDILYDIKGNQEILNEALLIAYRNGNEKEKQVLLDWGAQINYIYNAEVESETLETKLLEAVAENNYPLVKYIVENRNISNEALDNSLYLALQKQDTPMTLLLHEHGASFLDFDSTESPLQLLNQNNNKKAIVFAFLIFKSIALDSNKIFSFSNERFPKEIESVLKFINPLLSNQNHDIHKIIPSTVTEELSTYQNFYQAAKDFYTTNYQDTLNKFISINQEFQYGVACNKRFLLAFKHFKELRQILNDERFIESFQDSRQFELILTPMLDFGLDKFNFTTESIAKIITKFNDISLDLLITYANPNFNFKSVHEIVCMLAERNDTRSALFLLENLDIYKVDCAKLLLEIADIDISKNSCNNIFMIYTLIRVFSGKDYSNKFADYIELDLLRTHKILTASYKKVKKLLGDFNKSFSKEDLHLSIEHKDIEAIKSAIDNDSIAHSLFIEHLCSVGNIVTTSEFTIDIKTKETIKAKARNKILDNNSTRINIIKDSIKTSDLLSKEKAKEIYINAFKEAVQGDFYEGAKLISSKFDSYLEFLGTLHQLYSQGDSINVRGMLHHCDFKFKKVDLLMQVYNQKGFDQSSVELTKFILELGYTVKDEINDWVDTKTTKLCDNNYLKEATKFVHQYHDHPEVETLGAAAENHSGDLT